MRYIVDRIENDSLILEKEEGIFLTVPRELIPEAGEGDCIEININKGETKDRQKRVGQLMEDLFVD